MKTVSKPSAPISTLALAYRNGSRYVLNGRTYSDLPTQDGDLYAICPDGSLNPISEEGREELHRMEYLAGQAAPQGAREIPTE